MTNNSLPIDPAHFLSLRENALRQVRSASDYVRGTLLPSLDRSTPPTADIYFKINRCYFENSVRHGQLVQPGTSYRAMSSPEFDPYLQSSLEELCTFRVDRGNIGGFEVLHSCFVETLSERLFRAIYSAQNGLGEEPFLQHLAVFDFALQLLHLSKDGCGRTGEDILVMLGQNAGHPLTFSSTGHRGALDNAERLFFFREVTERGAHIELVQNFLRGLGIGYTGAPATHILDVLDLVQKGYATRSLNLPGWPDGLSAPIEAVFDSLRSNIPSDEPLMAETHPYHLYASFMAKELIYLILCLEDIDRYFGGLVNRYPCSMPWREIDLRNARNRKYKIFPPSLEGTADTVMAQIDLIRIGLLDHADTELENGKKLIRAKNSELADAIDVESASQSTETLMGRLFSNTDWMVTARPFREEVNNTLDWSL